MGVVMFRCGIDHPQGMELSQHSIAVFPRMKLLH
jgi:hypothetical protein